jgi:DNA-directed RNA polymerase subunit beta'
LASFPVKAKENIKKRTPVARKALLQETEERPVFINRAPSWHRFNILAMKPKLVPGKEIRVPNLPINSYMGGDFDGDTVTIHVPIGQKAVEEAKMMFPSKSLFKPGTRAGDNVKLMLQPEQSAVIGLNYLSRVGSYKDKPSFKSELEATASLKGGKIRADQPIIVAGKETTAGKILLKDVFPKDMPWTEGEITTSNLKKYLLKLAKEKPDEYGFYVNRINFFGEQYSAEAGFSVGIEDLVKLDDKIKPLLSQAERQSARARTPEEKIKALIELRDRAEKEIPKMIPQNNAFWQMMNISGKGNPNQIRQSLGAGLLYENAKGEIVPVPVKAPYAKGLSPAEYLIQQIGARKGIIDRSVETSKPGELGKRLLVSNADRVITMNDCGTRKGRLVNLKNAQDRAWALDHVLAEDTPVAPRGEVVTPAMIDELIKKGAETILVRSPLRCEAPRGLCAKCYGLNEKGEFPSIGDNVGVQESQTVMERSANFTLKAWHTSGASEKVSPFDRYAELVNVPRNIKNQAVVARVGGRIEEISKNSLGGYDIYINGEKHTTPPGVKPLTDPGDARAYDAKPIKVGDVVEPGDRLTTGNIRPQDLLNYKGLAPAQDYMSKELHGLLKDFGIQPKTVETVISGITNVAEIEDPGTSSFNYLDTAPINVLEDLNKQKEEIKHVNEAIGLVLSDDVRQYKKGTIVTPEIAMNLQLSGIREVKVEKKPIKYRPILNGIKTLPLIKSEDWLSNLDFVRVKDTIIDAASKGYKAPRHGYHPAGPYAIGVDFGKGDPDLPGSY